MIKKLEHIRPIINSSDGCIIPVNNARLADKVNELVDTINNIIYILETNNIVIK